MTKGEDVPYCEKTEISLSWDPVALSIEWKSSLLLTKVCTRLCIFPKSGRQRSAVNSSGLNSGYKVAFFLMNCRCSSLLPATEMLVFTQLYLNHHTVGANISVSVMLIIKLVSMISFLLGYRNMVHTVIYYSSLPKKSTRGVNI